ncbi:hypothetical protein EC930056_4632, partial [Escherichia coli 93.0056]
MASAPVWT